MKKKLLLLGGTSISRQIVYAAHEMDVDVYVTDYLENSPCKAIAQKSFMLSCTDVDKVVQLIKDEKIDGVLTGYADVQTGNPRYNMALSQRRADSVAKALVDRGISRDRINTVAKGDVDQPFSIQAENRVVICLSE